MDRPLRVPYQQPHSWHTWTSLLVSEAKVIGASVSSGAHSGLVMVWRSTEDDLLPSLVLDSTCLRPVGDEGRKETGDSLGLDGDP